MKLLILYENGAGGHRGAALALEEALSDYPNLHTVVIEVDQLAPPSRHRMYSVLMDLWAYFKPISRLLFGFACRPSPLFSLYRRYAAWSMPRGLPRLLEAIQRENPDLIVSTHCRPNLVCNTWLKQGRLRAPLFTVVTDYVAHGMWVHPRVGRYYVATPEVAADLTGHGVPAERVRVTGIPVSLRAPRPLGLEAPVVLVMGGARGDGDYDAVLQGLAGRVRPILLCGWNQRLRARLAHAPAMVLGFQDDMTSYYQAADVVLSKPGGLTVAEVLAAGRPLILISPHPGREELQAQRLDRAGVAIYAGEAGAGARLALELLEDRRRLEQLGAAAREFGRPQAARAIAADLVAQIQSSSRTVSS